MDTALGLLALTKAGLHSQAVGWLENLGVRIWFAYRSGHHFPITTNSYDLVAMHFGQARPKEKLMELSILLPMLAHWYVVLDLPEAYADFRNNVAQTFTRLLCNSGSRKTAPKTTCTGRTRGSPAAQRSRLSIYPARCTSSKPRSGDSTKPAGTREPLLLLPRMADPGAHSQQTLRDAGYDRVLAAAGRRAGVDYEDWYRVNNQSRLYFVDGVRTVVDRELAL
jgi:hypothetical protein